MSSNSSITIVNHITDQISYYGPIIFISIGTIGSICNFITFTSIQLKNNSCSLYFLYAAIFDLITINFGGITRLLSDHLGINPHNESQAYCKIRAFIINNMPATATAFIVAASIDRFLSTSAKATHRTYARTKIAKRMVPLIIGLMAMFAIQYILFFDLQPTCGALRGTFSIIVAAYSIIGTSIIPHVLMLGFGLGTYWHVRSARNRVQTFNGQQQQRRKKSAEVQLIGVSDTHRILNCYLQFLFIQMMLVQIGISSMLIMARTLFYSYTVLSVFQNKSTYQVAIDTMMSQITAQLFYINYSKSFYIYTLSSRYFRSAFILTMARLYRVLHNLTTH